MGLLALVPIAHANTGNHETPVSINVTTTINYVTSTCFVDVAPAFDLGELIKGPVTTHADLLVDIKCLNVPNVFTSLIASSSASTVTSTTNRLQLMKDNDHAWLSLSDHSSSLDADVNFDGSTPLCRATQNTTLRTCSLKVQTQVEPGNTTVGAFSVPVTFSMVYL